MFTIELDDTQGTKTVLHFGHPPLIGPGTMLAEQWFARRAGYDHVWQLDPQDMQLLTLPEEALYDGLLLRARRQDVQRVQLVDGDRTVIIRREEDHWSVSEARAGDDPDVEPVRYRADQGRVQDVVAKLEGSNLGDYVLEADFAPSDPPRSITVFTTGEVRWGGDIGAPHSDPTTGSGGRLYRRFGDDLCAVLHEDIVALCDLTLEDLRSRIVHVIRETDLHSIRLEHGGASITYVQTKPTEWRPAGLTILAPRDFTNCLETLLSLRAQRWAESSGELADELVVVTVGKEGEEHAFRLGRIDGVPVYAGAEATALLDFSQHTTTYGSDPLTTLLALFGE